MPDQSDPDNTYLQLLELDRHMADVMARRRALRAQIENGRRPEGDPEWLAVGLHNLRCRANSFDIGARAVVAEIRRLYDAAAEPMPSVLRIHE